MKIHCNKCGKYLGEVRDATLRNGIVYTCAVCAKPKSPHKSEMPDFLSGLFKGNIK